MNVSAIIARSVDLLPWSLRNRIKSIPGVAGAQRWIIERTMHGREFVHRISAGPARGLVFRVHMPADKLYWTGTWEHDVTTVIAKLARPGAVCCDIGGHRGFMAGVMLRAGASRVYCFEPNPTNAEAIEDLAALNPEADLRVLRYAVSAADGEAQFSVMPESSMGKLASSSFQHDAKTVETFQVTVRSLDSLIFSSEIPAPDFIKIDIEGAELDALVGASQLIADRGPTFLIELHSLALAQGCRELLEGAGYAVRYVQKDVRLKSEETYRVCHMIATRD